MSVYFAPIGSGLGDVIVALPILDWLIKHCKQNVILVARSERQLGLSECIEGLFGTVREVDLPQTRTAADQLINLREHTLNLDWDWTSDQFALSFPGYRINEIQRDICSDFGIFPDFTNRPKLLSSACPPSQGKVLLVPGTTIEYKSWPAHSWLALYEKLCAQGIDCLMIGEPEHSSVVASLETAGVPWLPTIDIKQAIDAVSSAALVVSVDTGLMHVAVQQGIETVGLFGNWNLYLRPYANCHALVAPPCQPECRPTDVDSSKIVATYEWGWWEGTFDYCKADKNQHCMNQITVEHVWQMVCRYISGPQKTVSHQ